MHKSPRKRTGHLLTRRVFVRCLAAAGIAAIPGVAACTAQPTAVPGSMTGQVPDDTAPPVPTDVADPSSFVRLAILADTHIDVASEVFIKHARSAFAALAQFDPAPSAIVINGDITNHGHPAEYDLAGRLASEAGLSFPGDFILSMGDHEQWGDIADGGAADYRGQRAIFLERCGLERLYYDLDVNGVHIVVLGPDADPQGWPTLNMSSEQLEWLREILAADEAGNRQTFVFLHGPADNTLPYTFEGEQKHGSFEASVAFREIVAEHPLATIVCSHTHSPAAFVQPDSPGPLYVATSAVAYTRPDAHTEWSEEGLSHSNGLLMDVYRDRTEFTAWDFVLGDACDGFTHVC